MPDAGFPMSRADALGHLDRFVPFAGQRYAAHRNTDPGPGRETAVSRLSPCLRYRVLTEQEVVAAVLARHGFAAGEKFVQEVLWRTYWKGWLEHRPAVWSRFLDERDRQRQAFVGNGDVAAAEQGATGIEGFDDWARELVATGYLHNHARMWFASIWIFTLRLPWVLGADFFLRHLADADPASNTLSWRWVAGLQTVGKTYLATGENISRYTNGRFAPQGLARSAMDLSEAPIALMRDLPTLAPHDCSQNSLLLVTHEDMHCESMFAVPAGFAGALVAADDALLWGLHARRFVGAAAQDAAQRIGASFGCSAHVLQKLAASPLVSACEAAGVRRVVTPFAPVGPVADALAQLAPVLAREGIELVLVQRPWDRNFWPHAQRGFFAFNKQIPAQLRECGSI